MYQKVKITFENKEEVEITESCPGNKKKDNPFSRDSDFLAVSLNIINICTQMLLTVLTPMSIRS